jgi:pimeloyl-ACP methyl ester carboxylesterase
MAHAANAHFFRSSDGLNLYYRDFGAQRDGTPVICLPGLTRNSRDFDDLAARLAERRRVLTVDLRGRGFSDHDPDWRNYHPGTYVADTWTLLDLLKIDRVIVVGTSLGGLCAMLMAAQRQDRVAGVLINDIGPEIDPAGHARVRDNAGRLAPVADWDEAVAQAKTINGRWLPGLSGDDWRRLARRFYREDEHGAPRLDIDPNIGRAIRELDGKRDELWTLFDALQSIPTVLIRGVLSDVLSAEAADRMKARKPDLVVVPVPNRGHAPLLDEPECIAAIDALLDRVP